MIEQAELSFSSASDPALDQRLAELLGVLRDWAGWITRRELEVFGFGERELRVLAEYDREARIFSYPSSPGYKHFDHVTEAEFDKCIALKTAGTKMLARYTHYLRRWHDRFKEPRGSDAVVKKLSGAGGSLAS